mgnify:CR=1 FL=1
MITNINKPKLTKILSPQPLIVKSYANLSRAMYYALLGIITEAISDREKDKKQINQILIGPYRVLPGRLSVSRTIGDIEAKSVQFGGNPQVIIPLPDVFIFDLQKDNIDFIILGCDGIYDQLSNEEILDSGWTIFPNDEIGNDINEKCGILVDFILKASMARKSFDNVTCVVIALKEIKDMKNDKNLKIKKFKQDLIQNHDLNENNNNIKNDIITPSIPVIQKKSFNSLSNISNIYPKVNILNNTTKERGITLNIDSSQQLRNMQRIKLDKKRKTKKIMAPKKRIISSGINNNLGFKNIRKILNKSEINPQQEKEKMNKLDTDRLHLKRTFINQMPKYNLTNSLNNLNFDYSNSPIEKIRHSINTLKINKISNRIHSSNHLIRKRTAQFTQNNQMKKNINLNKNKKRFITMNNLCGISNITNITNITNQSGRTSREIRRTRTRG